MTTTPNAVEQELARRGVYKPEDVPPAANEEQSRFALDRSPSGVESNPATVLAVCAENLASAYIQEKAERALPQTVTAALRKLGLTTAGEYVSVPIPHASPLVAIPTLKNVRPTKFATIDATAAELLDSFLVQESPGWDAARDEDVFAAAVEVARIHQLKGAALSRLSNAVARLVAARAGIVIGPELLP